MRFVFNNSKIHPVVPTIEGVICYVEDSGTVCSEGEWMVGVAYLQAQVEVGDGEEIGSHGVAVDIFPGVRFDYEVDRSEDILKTKTIHGRFSFTPIRIHKSVEPTERFTGKRR